MSKKLFALLLGALLLLVACSSPTTVSSTAPASAAPASSEAVSSEAAAPATASGLPAIAKEDLKVGFVYIGDINDGGYTQAHDKGRLALEAEGIECVYMENVPESAESEDAIRALVDQGCNVIYTTSYGFMDPTFNVAKDFPNVYFSHATGEKTATNMSTYMGRIEQPRYLAGIVAGLKTKSNKIGYVMAMPYAECIRGCNAFALGVQSVNPDATVEVVLTNTWYDPAVEKQAAMTLIDKGCDILAQHQDSTATQTAAEERGAFAIGYNTPTPDAAPKAYLTAPIFNWSNYYVADVHRIIDGTWKGEKYWYGMDADMVALDTLTALCPEGAQAKVDEAKAKILDGSLNVFAGPIYDQNGELKVPEGTAMADDEVWSMSWFVKGVIGNLA